MDVARLSPQSQGMFDIIDVFRAAADDALGPGTGAEAADAVPALRRLQRLLARSGRDELGYARGGYVVVRRTGKGETPKQRDRETGERRAEHGAHVRLDAVVERIEQVLHVQAGPGVAP